MADIGKKKGIREIYKFKYLENKRSFLDKLKNNFFRFLRANIYRQKIGDTVFNDCMIQLYERYKPNQRINSTSVFFI